MGAKMLPLGDTGCEPQKRPRQDGTCYLFCRDLTLSLLIVLTGFLLLISAALALISIFECMRAREHNVFFGPTTPMRAVTKSFFSDLFGPKEATQDDFF